MLRQKSLSIYVVNDMHFLRLVLISAYFPKIAARTVVVFDTIIKEDICQHYSRSTP